MDYQCYGVASLVAFNDPNSGLGKGRIIRLDDLNQEVLNQLLSSLTGTDQQVLQYVAGVLTAQALKIASKSVDNTVVPTDMQLLQYDNAAGKFFFKDLILATKPIDNTVVPTDGMVLTYDNASGKVKFKTTTSTALSEVQFLQGQSALGKGINVTGGAISIAANTSVASYTPANGTTFVLYQASYTYYNENSAGTMSVLQLRNNGVALGQGVVGSVAVGTTNQYLSYVFPTKGDQLIGNGVKVYDTFNLIARGGGDRIDSSIAGYLL